jgi:hypothetical protein
VRGRTLRRLKKQTQEQLPPEDDDILILRCVWNLREALRHLMAGDMIRGTRKVKLVAPDGTVDDDKSREIELAAVSEAQEAMRLAIVRSLINELPEPPKEKSE